MRVSTRFRLGRLVVIGWCLRLVRRILWCGVSHLPPKVREVRIFAVRAFNVETAESASVSTAAGMRATGLRSPPVVRCIPPPLVSLPAMLVAVLLASLFATPADAQFLDQHPPTVEVTVGDGKLNATFRIPPALIPHQITSQRMRWRVKDTDKNRIGAQVGPWLPNNTGQEFSAGLLRERTVVVPPSGCTACTALTNDTEYDVSIQLFWGGSWLRYSSPVSGTPTSGTPSNNADLSALTVTSNTSASGPFSPLDIGTFAADTLAYTASVATDITHVRLTPTRAHAAATIKVGKSGGARTAVFSGTASGAIALDVGENPIEVELTAQDSITKRTYTVTITRAAPPSNNADLSALVATSSDAADGTFSALTLSPVFAAGTMEYTASVVNARTHVKLTATVSDTGKATLQVGKSGSLETVADGEASGAIALAEGTNAIEVEVTAEDGSKSTYTVTVTRATAAASMDATLSGLVATSSDAADGTFSTLTLSPVFAAGTTEYTASVVNGRTHVKLTATVSDTGKAMLKVGKSGSLETVADGEASGAIALAEGANAISVEVTAEDSSKSTYTVTVTRAAAASTDATLSALTAASSDAADGTFSALTLSPVFAAGTTEYTASVVNGMTHVKLTATVSATGKATLKVGKSGSLETVADGEASGAIALAVGANAIEVEVTAEDGTTTETYTVTVTRAAAASTDATLSALVATSSDAADGTFTGLTLSPVFAAGTTEYTAAVGNTRTHVKLTATVSDTGKAMLKVGKSGSLETVADGEASGAIVLDVGTNAIEVEVTAEDGTTTETYTVTVTRAVAGSIVLSVSDATPNEGETVTVTATLHAAATDKYRVYLDFDGMVGGVSTTASRQSSTRDFRMDPFLDIDSGELMGTTNLEILSDVRAESDETIVITASAIILESTKDSTFTKIAFSDDWSRTGVVVTISDVSASTDATLSALVATSSDAADGTFSALALSPVFAAGTTEYTASVVTDRTHVRLTATVSDTGKAMLKVGKSGSLETVADGEASGAIALDVGANAIEVEVTAEDGTTTETYTVTVTRAAAASTDATLSALVATSSDAADGTFSALALSPVFAAGTTEYTASVVNGMTHVKLTATVSDTGKATLQVGKSGSLETVADGEASGAIALDVGANAIEVEVTAEDGTTTETYTVTVTRMMPAPTAGFPWSSTLTVRQLDPSNWGCWEFQNRPTQVCSSALTPDRFTFEGTVYIVSRVRLLGSDRQNFHFYLDKPIPESFQALALQIGDRSLPFATAIITGNEAQWSSNVDLSWTVNDRVTLNLRPASTDATLSALSLSVGGLTPDFAAATTDYTLNVTNAVESTKVTATSNDAFAIMTVKLQRQRNRNRVTLTSGEASTKDFPLEVGQNVLEVEVTAEDGTTTETYTVTVTRAAAASTDATLSALVATSSDAADGTFTGLALSPVFAAGTTEYTASVVNGMTHVQLTATVSDTGKATLKVGKSGSLETVADGEASGAIALAEGTNAIEVEVTAEDGTTTETYTVTVTRAAAASTDATLSALVATSSDAADGTFTGLALSPVFAAGTTEYTASVVNGMTHVKLTATVSATGKAMLKVGKSGSLETVADGEASGAIALAEGANAIEVEVTAEDGTTTETYTVTVTRAAAASTDATLSALTATSSDAADGTFTSLALSPVFAAGTTEYTASVVNGMTHVKLTATVSATGLAMLKVGKSGSLETVADGEASGAIALDVGANAIEVEVTAEDGTTTETYTVTVTRAAAASTDATLSALTATSSDAADGTFTDLSLSPVFAAGTMEYTVSVATDRTHVRLTATVSDTGKAMLKVGKSGSLETVADGEASGAIALDVGANAIEVEVTAEDGSKSTYTVTVTRAVLASLSAMPNPVDEGEGLMVTVTLSAALSEDVVIPIVLTAGTADVGDYESLSRIDISGGSTSGMGSIGIGQDEDGMEDETFTVALGSSLPVGVVAGLPASVEIVIRDNDEVPLDFEAMPTSNNGAPALLVSYRNPDLDRYSEVIVQLRPASVTGAWPLRGAMHDVPAGSSVVRVAGSGVEIRGGLDAGTAYAVRAHLIAMTGSFGTVISISEASAGPVTVTTWGVPGAPTSVLATAGDTMLAVGWAEPSDTGGIGAAITAYRIRWRVQDTDGNTAGNQAGSWNDDAGVAVGSLLDRTHVITGLDNGTVYEFAVRALNGIDPGGAWSMLGEGTPSDSPAASMDATLSALAATSSDAADGTFAGLTLSPAFAAGTTGYTASVVNGMTHVKLTATVADSAATLKVGKRGGTLVAVASGTASGAIALAEGANAIEVEVTAEDGTTTETYTVTVTRAAAVSTDATLSALAATSSDAADGTFAGLTLSPAFAAGTTGYTASVVNGMTHVKLTATVSDSAATLKVGKRGGTLVALASGTASGAIALAEGANAIEVEVTAEDGTTTETYTVTVTRAAAVSTDATLSALVVTSSDAADGTFGALTLSPVFAAGTTGYTASVGNGQTHAKLTATVVATGLATLKVGKSGSLEAVVDGEASGAIALDVGTNAIEVEVTAEDGTTTETYTVTVTRAAAASTDATLSALTATSSDAADGTFSALSLSPVFAAGTMEYTAAVANARTHVKLTATVADTGKATLKVGKSGSLETVVDGEASGAIALDVGTNAIEVEVTAEDGTTTETYTVTVTRAAALSADATLSALVATSSDAADGTFSALTLSPVFAAGTTGYTASVVNGMTHVKLTATVSATGLATLQVGKSGSLETVADGEASGAIALAEGTNAIEVEVTAEDGTTTETYTVTVTRAAAASTDATLSALVVTSSDAADGTFGALTLSPVFAAGTTGYTASVGNGQTHAKLTATVSDTGKATLQVGKSGSLEAVVDGEASGAIALDVGTNAIEVEVTAEDGTTTETYTVTVTRAAAASTDATLSALTATSSDAADGTFAGLTLSPAFASGTMEYTASVVNAVTHVKLTATVSATGKATLEVGKSGSLETVADGEASGAIALAEGTNAIEVEVTAEDGTTTETYTVTVTRAVLVSLSATPNPVNEGDSVVVTVTLSMALAEAVTVPVTLTGVTAEDGDYSALESIVIPVGQTSATGTIIAEQDDDRDSETFMVVLGVLPPLVSAGATRSVLLTIRDDDAVPLDMAVMPSAHNGQPALVVSSRIPDTNIHNAVRVQLRLASVTGAWPVRELDHSLPAGLRADAHTVPNRIGLMIRGGLSGGTEYAVRSHLVSLHFRDPVISEASAGPVTVTTWGVPGAPTSVLATAGDTMLAVGWAEPSDTGGIGAAITAYRIRWRLQDTDGNTAGNQAGNWNDDAGVAVDSLLDRTHVITGLSNGRVYEFAVRAMNGIDPGGAWSVLGEGSPSDGPPASTDATLSALVATSSDAADGTFSALSLSPAFAADTTEYTASVVTDRTHVRLTATVSATGKAMLKVGKSGSLETVADGEASGAIALDVGANAIEVEVTAEDGSKSTYTVTVTRAAAASTDATLSALVATSSDAADGTFTGLTLSPVFAAGTTEYTASVVNGMTHVKLTATVSDTGKAMLKVGKSGSLETVADGEASGAIALSEGANAISVEVTAEDGTTTNRYTVTVTRAAAASTDATLSALAATSSDAADGTFTGLTLSPAFAAGTTEYTAAVGNTRTHVKLTATVSDTGKAMLKVGKSGSLETVADGEASGAVALAEGANAISVEVTAEDGTTTNRYTVTVTRAAAASTDATLSALAATSSDAADGTFSALSLSPVFAAGTTEYTASVANARTHVRLTATVADSAATLKVGKRGGTLVAVASGTASGAIALAEGTNAIEVEVTAEDGTTTNRYTVTVTRAAAASTDATLSALTATSSDAADGTFGALSLSPAFAAGTMEYTAAVVNAVTHVKLTATVSDTGKATLEVGKSGSLETVADGEASGAIALAEGTNAIEVEVTAEDGTTTETYTVTVTRAAAGSIVLSVSDATPNEGETVTVTATLHAAATDKYRVYLDFDGMVGGVSTTASRQSSTRDFRMDPFLDIDSGELMGTTNLEILSDVRAESDETIVITASAIILESTKDSTFTKIAFSDDWSRTGVVVTISDVSASADATLSGLVATSSDAADGTFGALTLSPVFAAGTTGYTASVGNGQTHAKLTATVVATGLATLKVGKSGSLEAVVDGEASGAIALDVGANAIEVEVTAEDGTTTETYTVTVTRAAAVSTDATLSALVVTSSDAADGTFGALALSPVFAAGTTEYTASVVNGMTHVRLTATVVATGLATLKVGKSGSLEAVVDGEASGAIALDVGANAIEVEVMAEDGTTNSYTVTITRAAALSTDADLSALVVTSSDAADGTFGALTLSPVFAAGTTGYTASVGNGQTHAKLTATVVATGLATLKVGKSGSLEAVVDGEASGAIALDVGANAIEVEVTAEDGTTNSYTVTITRAVVARQIPTVSLSAVPSPVSEGSSVTVTVTLSAVLASDVEVPIVLTAETAEAGDYGALSAITIASGTTSGRGTITTAQDMDEDDETFRVALGSPLPAELMADAMSSVLLRIEDDDRMAELVERLNRSVLPELARASGGRTVGVIGKRIEEVLDGEGSVREVRFAGQPTLLSALAAHTPEFLSGTGSVAEFLSGTGFALPFSAVGDGSGGGILSSAVLWGSGDWRRLSGAGEGLNWDGSLYGAEVGMDVRWHEDMLAGVALSWSRGDFSYSGGGSGDYTLDIVSVHPYLGWRFGGLDVWLSGGYGAGEVEVVSREVLSGDVNLWTVGGGASGELWSRGDMAVRLRGELLRTELEVEEGVGMDSLSVATTLARVGVEGSRRVVLSGGGEFRPSVSFGGRHDGGDGDTGTGAELRGGLGYVSAGGRLSAEVSVHGLLGRGDYEEWGVSAQVALLPSVGGGGWSFALRPGYGSGIAEGGSTGRIWGQGVRKDALDAVGSSAGLRVESRLGYGLVLREGRGLVTPWGGLTLDEVGRRYRLGLDWGLGSLLRLNLSAERREAAGLSTDHAVFMEGEARF